MKVIGFLNSSSNDSIFQALVNSLRDGLKENGFVEGQNVQIVSEWANGKYPDLPKLARSLVERQVDVIATTGGTVAAQAAVKATKTIPVLFISGFDPGKAGLLKPGNATGVNVATTESVPDRLAILRHLAPDAKKVAVLLRPGTFVFAREKEQAYKARLIVVQAKEASDLPEAFASAVKKGAQGLIVCADPFLTSQSATIVALANEHKLPTVYPWRQYTSDGGLASFGPNLSNAYFQVGAYAGMILKGIKPGALSVQRTKSVEFELAVNRETAKSLNLSIPNEWARRAVLV